MDPAVGSPPKSFLAGARRLGLELDARAIDRLGTFLDRLLEANQRFNLTAVTDLEEAWTRHVLDSLTLLGPLGDAQSIVDVGSGGGLPALPLAIALPDASFTLIEATGKKASFLEETAQALGLTHVRVVRTRAEEAGAPGSPLREAHDAVTARAVAPLAVLLELTLPLAKVHGRVIAIKGEKAPQEIAEAKNALELLRGRVISSTRTETGTLVVIEKVGPTPNRYPRRPGEPKRSPL